MRFTFFPSQHFFPGSVHSRTPPPPHSSLPSNTFHPDIPRVKMVWFGLPPCSERESDHREGIRSTYRVLNTPTQKKEGETKLVAPPDTNIIYVFNRHRTGANLETHKESMYHGVDFVHRQEIPRAFTFHHSPILPLPSTSIKIFLDPDSWKRGEWKRSIDFVRCHPLFQSNLHPFAVSPRHSSFFSSSSPLNSPFFFFFPSVLTRYRD